MQEEIRRSNWTPRQETLAIIEAIASDHGCTAQDVLSTCRRYPIVRARHAAMVAVARARPHLSLPQLGRIFYRDHTTVMWAFEKHGYRHNSKAARENGHDQAR